MAAKRGRPKKKIEKNLLSSSSDASESSENIPKVYNILYYVPKTDQISYSDPFKFQRITDSLPKEDKEVRLILHTLGGDPYAAAKIVNILHKNFTQVSVIVPYWAMSAGTLIALGGNKVILSEASQLGPLDMQIPHPITEKQISALDYINPVSYIVGSVMASSERFYRHIRKESSNRITAIQAMKMAYRNSVKLVEPVIRQLEPIELSKSSRILDVAERYATSFLMKYSLKDDHRTQRYADLLISHMIYGYPDHGFGIFCDEVEELGLNVVFANSYSEWGPLVKKVSAFIDDDLSNNPKRPKTIELIKL